MGDPEVNELGALILVAMLGVTGCAHLFAFICDSTPLAVEDAPQFRLWLQIGVTLSIAWYRGLYWVYLFYRCVVVAWKVAGLLTTAFTVAALGLFTLFNVDFYQYNRKAWLAVQQKKEKMEKKEVPTNDACNDATDIKATVEASAGG